MASRAFPFAAAWRGFETTMLGVSFNVFIGNSLSQGTRKTCLYRSPQNTYLLDCWTDASLDQGYYPTLAKASRKELIEFV